MTVEVSKTLLDKNIYGDEMQQKKSHTVQIELDVRDYKRNIIIFLHEHHCALSQT